MLQEFEIPLGVTSATEAPFGFECAGKVTAVGQGVTQFDVGDDVIAVGAGAMRSHILLDARTSSANRPTSARPKRARSPWRSSRRFSAWRSWPS